MSDGKVVEIKKGPINKPMLCVLLMIAGIGLLMVFSAGSYAAQNEGGSALDPFIKQGGLMVGGLVILAIGANIPYRFWRNPFIVFSILLFSIFMLIIVLIPSIGKLINGSRRWIEIFGISVQPGEIAKFALVIFIAQRLSLKYNQKSYLGFIAMPVLMVAGAMFLLIMEQPNLSTAGSIIIIAGIMRFIGGMDLKHVAILVVLGLIVGVAYALSAEYRRERLLLFLDPWEQAGDETYQLVQSLYAIASGGLFGRGIGQSMQKLLFLPYCDSDFIFAVVAEELGFFGTTLVVGLFAAFIVMGCNVARRCKDRHGSMLAMGLTVFFAVQIMLNIAVVTGCFPTTGLPMPFFSAGGTSLWVFMGAAGILLNVSRYAQPEEKKAAVKDKNSGAKSDNVRSFPDGKRLEYRSK